MNINMLVIVAEPARRERLWNIFASCAGITVLGGAPDPQQAFLASSRPQLANLVAVDLSDPETGNPRFWTTLHVIYPAAKVMALVEQPPSELALLAALNAGTHCFALWSDPAEKLCEAARAACEGRRFYSEPWLIAAVQKLIRDIETGVIRLGFARPEQSQRGEPIPELSRLESKLWVYLLHNEGRVITPEELAREVWKQADVSEDANQVRCCVKRLRRKLDENGPHKIETIRGRGYRLRRREQS